MSRVSIGLDLSTVRDLSLKLEESVANGFDFIAAPLFHPRFHRDAAGVSDAREGPGTRSDTVMPMERWHNCVVGKLSPWIELDSPVLASRLASEKALKQEVAPHISVALLVTVQLPDAEQLRRWSGEPVKAALLPTALFGANKKGYPTLPVPHQRLLLQLHAHRAQFVLTGRPAPVRSADSGLLLYADNPYKPYLQYLTHVLTTGGATGLPGTAGGPTGPDAESAAYLDFLQAPLQPLADNLEAQTYETFERDPVKYRQYETAITCALAATPAAKTSVVMVVGAGRGPLVQRTLAAAAAAGRAVRVYAVEKNPNAVVTLRNLQRTQWGARVTVVAGDMRRWAAPEPADLLVSELLGSFGDNELSPECLDGAQRFLKPPAAIADAAAALADAATAAVTAGAAFSTAASAGAGGAASAASYAGDDAGGGVSIPSSYTSYLCPVASSKLWNDVRGFSSSSSGGEGGDRWFETPFVVKMHAFHALAPPQPVFTFVHPNRAAQADNRRAASLRFVAAAAGVVHGLAGYFDATLFGETRISIVPATHSADMFSWFPLFFPLRTPLAVRAGEAVEVRMWRCVSPSKVWYEWAVTAPTVTAIHNPGGRSYYVGL